jgi:SNF2 family DNA or RNA helicase
MELYKHQKDWLATHWEKTGIGLFWQMGTAKTLTSLLNLKMLHTAGKINGMLVIAPNGVHAIWEKEVKKWLPEFRVVTYYSRNSMPQRQAIKELFQNTQGVRILAINAEALSYPASEGVKLAYDFLRAVPSIMVVDESTVIKNPRAMRTKVAMKLSQFAQYRRVLTGSPIADNPFDCWSQLEFLERGSTGMNYFQFMKEHGVYETVYMGTRSFTKVAGYKRLDQLKMLMEKHGTFISKAECLDLPPKVYERREVELDLAQRKIYQMVKNDISVMLADNYIEPVNAMAKLQYLHNITMGFVKHDDGVIEWISTTRIIALINLLEELDDKVIVWCSSVPALLKLYEAIVERFGKDYVVKCHGDVDPRQRPLDVQKFQEVKECRVYLANQETGGYGSTLTAASFEVYFRNSYSLEDRLQSEDRAHRIGQTKSVTIIDIIAPATVDEHVLSALERKLDIAAHVVDFLKVAAK